MEIKRKLEQQNILYKIQNRPQNKDYYKRQEGKLCNDQGTNFKNTIIVNIYAPNIGEPQYKGKS